MTDKNIPDRRPVVVIADYDQKTVERMADELMVGDFDIAIQSTSVQIEDLVGAQPDVVILGSRLEDASGFAILKKMRKHPALKYIPVIMLTTTGRNSELLEALNLGAIDAMPKPVDPQVLKLKLSRIFQEFVPVSRTKTEFLKYMQSTINKHTQRGQTIYCKHMKDLPSAPADWDIPVPDLIVVSGKTIFVYEFVSMHDLSNPEISKNWKLFNQFKDIHLRVCVMDEDGDYVKDLLKYKGIRARLIKLDAVRKKAIKHRRFKPKTILIIIAVSIVLGGLLSLPMRNIYEYSKKWIHGVKEQYNKYEPFDLQRGDQFEDELKKATEEKKKLEPPPK